MVEGNLTVIREAFEATQRVNYDDPEFAAAEKAAAAKRPRRGDFGLHVPSGRTGVERRVLRPRIL